MATDKFSLTAAISKQTATISKHLTIAKLTLVSIIALLIASPWLRTDIEDILILCSGLSNMVAIIDISRLPELLKPGRPHRLVRGLLTAQLFLFAWIIGADVGHTVKQDAYRIALSCSIVLVTIFYVALSEKSPTVKTALLIFGLILSGALHTNAEALAMLEENLPDMVSHVPIESCKSFMQQRLHFAAERGHAWVHLLFIPVIYTVVDSIIRNRITTSEKAIVLDIEILLVGLACAFAGIKADNPRFEAGAAAAVLLLGNWVYVSYIHKATLPPETPQTTTTPAPQTETTAATVTDAGAPATA